MTIRTLRLLLAASLTLLLTLASAQSLEQIRSSGTIRVATANEIPYGWVDENGEAQGIAPDVAEAVLAQMGIDNVEWTVTDFGSLIPGLKAGRFDMAAASQAILPARCQQVLYSVPNSSYGEGFLVAAGNPKGITSYDDFVNDSSLKLGIVSGADQLDFAHALGISENQLVVISSNTDALSAVETGRIDAYAATGLTVARLAEGSDKVEAADPFEDPVIDGKPVRSWGGFTFNLDAEELRDAFNEALTAFQETDGWREILMSYGLSERDVEAVRDYTTEELCSAE